MSNLYSVQMASGYAKLLGALLALIGVEVADNELVTVIGVLMTIASTLVAMYDRHAKGDIKITGKRK